MAKKATKTTKKSEFSAEQKVAAGVGLTAAAVAAAGAYFLYGSKGAANNRKTVKSWALKAKAEVLERLEDAKEMTADEYEELIATVAGTYAGVKGASKKEIKEFAAEMHDHWQKIEKAAKPKAKKAKKETKSVAKAAVKAGAKAGAKAATKTAVKKTAKKVTKKK